MFRYIDPAEEFGPQATMADAVREHVSNVGAMDPDRAWIVSQYDTLEANPYYAGPAVPHPYDEEAEWLAEEALADIGDVADLPVADIGFDEAIPF